MTISVGEERYTQDGLFVASGYYFWETVVTRLMQEKKVAVTLYRLL